MKTLTLLLNLGLTLGSLNAFALTTHTHCDTINLQKDHSAVNVYLSKEGELEDGDLNLYVTDEKSHEKIEIDGLQSQIVSATLLDSTTKNHWGFGGGTTTFTKVYGVKLHVSANESIGHEINGCIPRPINELDTYAICYQSSNMTDRQ